jgi:hypothetical protein
VVVQFPNRLIPPYRPLKWLTRSVIEGGVRKVEGDWEDWVVPELKSWSTTQKSHPLDQNYFETARMQGAVRNDFCIFRVLPDESNTPQISHSYTPKIDDTGKKLTKPKANLRISSPRRLSPGIRWSLDTHSIYYRHLFDVL